eukprot:3574999-Pyramimonas_sp.AAC.1
MQIGCNAVQSSGMRCKATQCDAKQCKAIQGNEEQWIAMQSSAMQSKFTMLFLPCYAMRVD